MNEQRTAEQKLTPCAECRMPVRAKEYHPYGACLMYKGCCDSESVRANLEAIADHYYQMGREEEARDRDRL